MPSTPNSSTASTGSAQPRLLSGAGASRSTGTKTAEASTFTATVPFKRPQPQARPAQPAPAGPLPRWAKNFVIGGVLLAVAMPAAVLMSRSMLVQKILTEESSSKAAMVCTAGDAHAADSSSLLGWLFGGSYFQCGEWETREARQQRERDQEQANYLARERAKLQR